MIKTIDMKVKQATEILNQELARLEVEVKKTPVVIQNTKAYNTVKAQLNEIYRIEKAILPLLTCEVHSKDKEIENIYKRFHKQADEVQKELNLLEKAENKYNSLKQTTSEDNNIMKQINKKIQKRLKNAEKEYEKQQKRYNDVVEAEFRIKTKALSKFINMTVKEIIDMEYEKDNQDKISEFQKASVEYMRYMEVHTVVDEEVKEVLLTAHNNLERLYNELNLDYVERVRIFL